MGLRAHIIDRYDYTVKTNGEGAITGYTKDVTYLPTQTVWMNNRKSDLYDWVIDFLYGDYCLGEDGDADEWELSIQDLKSIPDEAFKDDAVFETTGEELKKFITDCTSVHTDDGLVRIDWY
jgi:hypothetical protein